MLILFETHERKGVVSMDLLVQQYGTFISKHQGRLRIISKVAGGNEQRQDVSLLHGSTR